MSLPAEYDANSPPQWFRLRNIKYWLGDPVVVNGEDSSIYYALISEIRKENLLLVQWFYLPQEMVMSRSEKASLHSNEIFVTDSTDIIDVESVQMKAAIFHTKGFAPPKKIPPEWMILRRKYNPYKKIIRGIDLVADNLQKIDKLNVSLCEPDRQSSKKTPSRSSKKVLEREPYHSVESDDDMKSVKTMSSSDENRKEQKSAVRPSSTPESLASTKKSQSTYFFMSSEDFPPTPNEKDTPKRSYPSRSSKKQITSSTPQITKEQTSKINTKSLNVDSKTMNNKSEPRKGRSTRLTSELQTLSLSPQANKLTTQQKQSPVTKTEVKTPITRSGRAVKPVENFHSLQKSLAIEALMRSNLLTAEKDDSTSESDEDHEISFKENKHPKSAPSPKQTKDIKKKKKRKDSMSSDSSGNAYNVKKKKKRSNVRTPHRTPLAPKNLKSTTVATPCVVPMREAGDKKETSYSAARTRLHVSAVPETLPCREEQFADIYYFLETKLEEKSGGCMYISGVPGTGKTATVRDVLTHISDGNHDYQMIEINGMKLSDPKQLYSLIYRHLEGKKVTPDHGNLLLSEYFGRQEKKSIVLVVDELDLLWTRKQHVMYNLFDWPNRPNSKLVVIAIANTMDLPERMLMNKVASRLGLTRMTFQPYSHKQLLEIINSRLEGTSAFAPEACMLAARKVAAASGDARRALDICRHAIDIAEQEQAGTVTSLHIQRAITNMYQSAKTKAIINCTLYQKIFLKSVLGVFRRKGVEEAVFKEVYEVFCSLCQFQGIFCPPCGAMLQLCVELGGCRILLVEQGPPTLHTHIRLNCAQDDVVFALKEGS